MLYKALCVRSMLHVMERGSQQLCSIPLVWQAVAANARQDRSGTDCQKQVSGLRPHRRPASAPAVVDGLEVFVVQRTSLEEARRVGQEEPGVRGGAKAGPPQPLAQLHVVRRAVLPIPGSQDRRGQVRRGQHGGARSAAGRDGRRGPARLLAVAFVFRPLDPCFQTVG